MTENYVENNTCLIFPQKVLNENTGILPSFFQIKMLFNSI